MNEEIQFQLDKFDEDGYVVIRLNGANELIDTINCDVDQLIESGNYKTNSKIYSYNNSPRIVESWKYSVAAKNLAFNEQITDFLSSYYQAVPRPFSTINFLRSTEQPLHSDYVHFGTIPQFRLAAVWVALEDIDYRSGPIQVVAGSHRMSEFTYSQIGLPVARSLGDIKRHYEIYENWVRSEVSNLKSQIITPNLQKGDAIIWQANLLHGSPDCLDNGISRKSQVIHYHFDDTEVFYNPSFSDPIKEKYVLRDVKFIPSA